MEPFAYANYYFATDALSFLAQEVSGDPAAFAAFRARLTGLTEQIQERVDEVAGTSIALTNGAIVVNRYTNLMGGAAFKLEGMIESKRSEADGLTAVQLPFQALLDMADVSGSGVFIPSSTTPNQEDLEALRRLNERLVQLGDQPNVPHIEPPRVAAAR